MKQLQLTTVVRDIQTAAMNAQAFARFPVLVGRQSGNQLRLDARIVSRRQGAFLFSKDGLQYIDYNSANGSYVDGVRVAPNVAIDIGPSSLITIAPFQIVARIDLVEMHRIANDPDASTPVVALLRPRAPGSDAHLWQSILDGGAALQRSGSLRASIELAERARRVIEVFAAGMLTAGSRTAVTLSPLRAAATPRELVALLLDEAHGDARLGELRALLAELFRPRLSSIP